MRKLKKKKGFTLIELIVVIVIIGILLLVLIPNVMSAKNKAEDVAYDLTIKKLHDAAVFFTIDYPSTAVTWSSHDGGTKARHDIEITAGNLHEAWYKYLDEWPKNPKKPKTTFIVEISEDGEIRIFDKGY
jgi:prepilin-type N-terminal cleavage/methylation domain-containing protein